MRKAVLSILVSLTLALGFGTSLAFAAPGGSSLGTQAEGEAYTITFVMGNDGATQIDPVTVVWGEKATAPDAPTATGYEFSKWTTDAAGETAFSWDTEVKQNYTLYGQWTENEYTIKFEANAPNGTTATGKTDSLDNVKYTATETGLTDNGFSIKGYRFYKWVASAEVAGEAVTKDFVDGDNAWAMADLLPFADDQSTVTLKAQWIKTYTVTFNTDGRGTIASKTVDTGDKVAKPADPEALGYVFGGWYTSAARADADKYDFNTAVEADLELYAKWTVQTFDVTFDLQGHGAAIDEQTINYGLKAAAPDPAPTETGYEFGGWFTDAACDAANEYDFGTPVTAPVELFAKWTANTYTISFDANVPSATKGTVDMKEAEGTFDAITATYDADQALPDAEPTLAGYDFKGWTTDKSPVEDAVYYQKDADVKNISTNANVTLYAQWQIQKRAVTFVTDYNGVVGASEAPAAQKIDYETAATKPADPTATSATSDGKWYKATAVDKETDEVTLDTTEFDFATEITEDVTLYAGWTINPYTVTFTTTATDVENPESVDAATVNYGATATEPTAPESDNAQFKGWFLKDGDEVAETEFDFENTPITANIELQAKWGLGSTITFVNDDGTKLQAGVIETDTVPTYNGATDPTKTSTDTAVYTFAGWKTGTGDEEVKYKKGEDLPAVDGEATYTAYYDEGVHYYTVKWVDGDGNTLLEFTQERNTDIAAYAGTPTKAKVPQYTYEFHGKWKDDADPAMEYDTTADNFAGFGKVTKDVTFAAQFDETVNEYPVTFVTHDAIEAPTPQAVKYGAYVGDPKLVVDNADYEFDGFWYTDEAKTTKYNFENKFKPETIVEDFKLYAGLTEKPASDEQKEQAERDSANAAAILSDYVVSEAGDGSDVATDKVWLTQAQHDALQAAVDAYAADQTSVNAKALSEAVETAQTAAETNGAGKDATKAAATEAEKTEATNALTEAEQLLADATAGKVAMSDADKAALEAAVADAKIKQAADTLTSGDVAKLKAAVSAGKSAAKIKVAAPTGKTLTYNGKSQTGVAAATGYTVKGNTGKDANSYSATATLADGYVWSDGTSAAKTVAWKINQATQKVTTKNKTVKLKAKKLKTKAQTVKAATVKKGNSAKTAITYTLVKANKSKAKFKVAKNGKITVKKGLKKGTYKLTIKASAAENAKTYKAAAKTFTVTIRVTK